MDELEREHRDAVAALQARLDAEKTENLTMCLEMEAVGTHAQRAERKVRRASRRRPCFKLLLVLLSGAFSFGLAQYS